MNAGGAMRTACPRKLRQSIREVAQGGTAHRGDQAEGSDGNANSGIEAVEQKHQPGDRDGGNDE